MKGLVALVLLLGLAACSGSDSDGPGDDTASDARPFSPAPTDKGGETDAVDLAGTDVCGLVREGVDAFNVGDLEGTIAKFEEALPLAEDLADDKPSDETRVLLDAIRYYAELPAEDYVEANQSAPDFQRFKAFTLTACAYEGPPAGATDPAIPA
ncbi:hypothetical protein [Nocardioides sp.]|uniref:hypothetical protein n=1 Tax=Nocardioides sp. TaxID=35761 RepID=UPI00271CECD7|nr:hypothetical protein [Nocardioides sp.]MDO9456265.1 hypothetical protein [Nocardioides sp.]